MLNLDVVIEEKFENEIDRAIEYLKRGYDNEANFNIGNKILQNAYDKYFERTKNSHLRAYCLRNLAKVCGILENDKLEKKYSEALYWNITQYDPYFKDNDRLYYCKCMSDVIDSFKDVMDKQSRLRLESDILNEYMVIGDECYENICVSQFNICLLNDDFDGFVNLLKDIHTSNINGSNEIINDIIKELATTNTFWHKQAKDLLKMGNSLQVV